MLRMETKGTHRHFCRVPAHGGVKGNHQGHLVDSADIDLASSKVEVNLNICMHTLGMAEG